MLFPEQQMSKWRKGKKAKEPQGLQASTRFPLSQKGKRNAAKIANSAILYQTCNKVPMATTWTWSLQTRQEAHYLKSSRKVFPRKGMSDLASRMMNAWCGLWAFQNPRDIWGKQSFFCPREMVFVIQILCSQPLTNHAVERFRCFRSMAGPNALHENLCAFTWQVSFPRHGSGSHFNNILF